MKSIINDFPKEKLSKLFLEAKEIIILQSPDLSLALMSDNFTAGLRKAITTLVPELEDRPKVILCTNFFDYFKNDPDIDMVIGYGDYEQFLKQEVFKKFNILVIDLTNDETNKLLFEYNRMTKWPVRQRPFLSQITFQWWNLPVFEKEKNSIAARYLLLAEDIFKMQLAIKPRYPRVYLSRKNVKVERQRQLIFAYFRDSFSLDLFPENLLESVDYIFHKKKNVMMKVVLDPVFRNATWIKELQTYFAPKKRFLSLRQRELDIQFMTEKEFLAYVAASDIVVSHNTKLTDLLNALGVRSVSLRGATSRHFIPNERLDVSLYAPQELCPSISKVDSYKGKGYMSQCYNKASNGKIDGKCMEEIICIWKIPAEKIISQILTIL